MTGRQSCNRSGSSAVWPRFVTAGLALALCGGPVQVYAEDAPAVVATATPPPQRGILASTSDRGYGTQSNPAQWGGMELEGKNTPAVTASVARGARSNWDLKVFNNSEDIYTVTIALEQLDKAGARLNVDSFTFSLKAGQKQSRSVPATLRSTGAVANRVSWKKVPKKGAAAVTPVASPAAPARALRATPTPVPMFSDLKGWPQRPRR